MEDLDQTYPLENDVLRTLGLIHDYPLHIDVLNNETGFALYVETTGDFTDDGAWGPVFSLVGDEGGAKRVHVDDYISGMEPEYDPDDWFDDLYLRIREVAEDGSTGEWHTMKMDPSGFTKNTNPPDALDDLGFNDFDSVTWLEGLEADKDYQVQLWFDTYENGQLDSQGRFVREKNVISHQDGTITEEPGDYYYWQAPDVYSDIHNINTDAEDFNVDIDDDGVMDFFILQDLIITLAEDSIVKDAQGGAGDDTIQGNSDKNRLEGNAGNDSLMGGAGNDVLYGHAGSDVIKGDNGNDYIVGGSGDDRLGGGPGNDVFVFGPRDGNYEDVVIDFNDGADRLDLRKFMTLHSVNDLDLSLSGNGADSYIDLTEHGGGIIVLADFTGPLSADDVLFS